MNELAKIMVELWVQGRMLVGSSTAVVVRRWTWGHCVVSRAVVDSTFDGQLTSQAS